MRIPGFAREFECDRPAPEAAGDRLFPQLESYCARECRAACDSDHAHHSDEWYECYDSCMATCW
ncbi:hypothetical protein [Streptomyces sp.]|uniref:hypothetical protein n=1 Tax=Streptomyces sp. TaxID=1931 RepID=UPI002F92EFF3